MIEKSELVGIISNAFQPLKCEAGIHDYNLFVWYRVHLPNGDTLIRNDSVFDLSIEYLSEEHQLVSEISSTRTIIGHKGITLDEWSSSQKS